MSGLAIGRGKVVGLTAAAAMLLSATSGGAAVAASAPQSPQSTMFNQLRNQEPAQAPAGAFSADSAERAAAAEEDPTPVASVCTISSYAPTRVVLGASPIKVKFSVKVKGCTLDEWLLFANPFVSDDLSTLDGIAGNLEGLSATTTLSPKVITNAEAGKLQGGVDVLATGKEDPPESETVTVEPAFASFPLTVQRQSTFAKTFKATPDPVKKGKAITLKAALTRINWNGAKTLKFGAFGKAKVQVQFRADGSTKYVAVKTVSADAKGKISTTVKATKSGRYRFVFAGISTTAPATSTSDAVVVKS
jgi:hypothetical protein